MYVHMFCKDFSTFHLSEVSPKFFLRFFVNQAPGL